MSWRWCSYPVFVDVHRHRGKGNPPLEMYFTITDSQARGNPPAHPPLDAFPNTRIPDSLPSTSPTWSQISKYDDEYDDDDADESDLTHEEHDIISGA